MSALKIVNVLIFTTFILNAQIQGTLTTNTLNNRYFIDSVTGRAVYFSGSHNWFTVTDRSSSILFDYSWYISWLKQRSHNFIRLWACESRAEFRPGFDGIHTPLPYLVTSTPGAYGGNKYDLTQFNQSYFDRLRDRCLQAQSNGIYVAIMLFNGWDIENKAGNSPWIGNPFNLQNNINGINGDINNNSQGEEVHQLLNTNILNIQKAYVRKVIDTVNDLKNILYEVSNESLNYSTAWQYEIINYVKQYQSSKTNQHLIGMTFQYPDGNDATLFNSPADWVSPGYYVYRDDPLTNNHNKVVIMDTDHLWGIGGNVMWVWKSFTRGLHTIFMDDFGLFGSDWESIRVQMGKSVEYANKVDLNKMFPRSDLATGYCLTDGSKEYIIFQPGSFDGSFYLNLVGNTNIFTVEWFNPQNNTTNFGTNVAGGSNLYFKAPFSGQNIMSVLLLKSISPQNVELRLEILQNPLRIKLTGNSGQYRLEISTNLIGWIGISTNLITNTTSVIYTNNADLDLSRKFYRVVKLN